MSIYLMSIGSAFATAPKHDSYIIVNNGYIVHAKQGDQVTIKVELYGQYTGFPWGDKWLDSRTTSFNLSKLKPDQSQKQRERYMDVEESTNWKGNAYFTVDTSELKHGTYDICASWYGDSLYNP